MKKGKNTKYRPIELVHDFRFIPCSFPQDMELPSPEVRMERLKDLGYGGIALSPSYTDYLSERSMEEACGWIRYAHELGLRVWIYDEKFYPSGSAAGTVPRENPMYEAKAVAMFCGEPDEKGVIYLNSPHGYGSVLAAFICELDSTGEPLFDTLTDVSGSKTFGGGIVLDCGGKQNLRVYAFFGKSAFEFCTTSHNTRGVRRYIDTLDKNASDAFLNKTYTGYDSLGTLGKYVEAAFTDEPQIPALCRQNYRRNYLDFVTGQQSDVFRIYDTPDSDVAFSPYIPWTEQLPDAFLTQHGYDLIPALPRLFADEGPHGRNIRADFWETVSRLFRNNFGKNYSEFCRKAGIMYSGHFLGEEMLPWHPYMHGDLLAQLGEMDIPGCDMLYASPKKILESASAVKFASSAAQLYGKRDVMIEASNIMRDVFPITQGTLMLATALEAALGITRFLSYYTDYCMSDDDLRACNDFTENLLSTLDGMEPIRSVYVYVPNRDYRKESYPAYSISEKKEYSEKLTAMDSFVTQAAEKLCRANIDFNYINDECICAIKADENKSSKVLIVPPAADVPQTAAFGTIITDTDIDDAVSILVRMGCASITATPSSELISLHKYNETAEAFLLVNTGENFTGTVLFRKKYNFANIYVYNPHDNSVQAGSTKENINIPAGECRIVLFSDMSQFC